MAKTPKFQYRKSEEKKYAAQLKKIARHIGDIIDSHTDDDGIIPELEQASLMRAASLYSDAIEPWAKKVAWQMISAVSAKNKNDWLSISSIIGKGMESIVKSDNVSALLKDRQAEQVALIKTIPIDAAERAKQLSIETYTQGRRIDEAARMISESTGVSQARAAVIARTETAKTNHDVSMARAKSIGVQKYTWETMQDEAVRPTHEELQGEIFDIDNPPEIEGEGAHGPGDWINCRCFPAYIVM
jgi:SPP1 gp7 family putative phage head morphogenesis protein